MQPNRTYVMQIRGGFTATELCSVAVRTSVQVISQHRSMLQSEELMEQVNMNPGSICKIGKVLPYLY